MLSWKKDSIFFTVRIVETPLYKKMLRSVKTMKAILCLDDNGGMAFNHRRQSRDRCVTDRILQLCAGRPLRLSPYSVKIFPTGNVLASDDYLSSAGDDDYCFVELDRLAPYEMSLKGIIIFRWNRVYPADLHFDLDLSKWRLATSEEFPGYSHEKITMEVYER